MKFFDLINVPKKAVHKMTLGANQVTLTGTGGTANITVNGVTRLATWNTSLTQTATDFVAAHFATFLNAGLRVSSAAAVLTFTPVAGWKTSNDVTATIANVTTNLNGTLAATLVVDFNKARIWQVTVGCPYTIAKPVNMRDGDVISLELKVTGSFARTWDTSWQFAGGTEMVQTASGLDICNGRYNATADKVYIFNTAADVKAKIT